MDAQLWNSVWQGVATGFLVGLLILLHKRGVAWRKLWGVFPAILITIIDGLGILYLSEGLHLANCIPMVVSTTSSFFLVFIIYRLLRRRR